MYISERRLPFFCRGNFQIQLAYYNYLQTLPLSRPFRTLKCPMKTLWIHIRCYDLRSTGLEKRISSNWKFLGMEWVLSFTVWPIFIAEIWYTQDWILLNWTFIFCVHIVSNAFEPMENITHGSITNMPIDTKCPRRWCSRSKTFVGKLLCEMCTIAAAPLQITHSAVL